MNAGKDQQHEAATCGLSALAPEPEGSTLSNDPSPDVRLRDQSLFGPTGDDLERLLACQELSNMEREAICKDRVIALTKSLLERAESRVRQLARDLKKAKNKRDKEIQARKEANAKNFQIMQHLLDAHKKFDMIQKMLNTSDAAACNQEAWNGVKLYSENMTEHLPSFKEAFQTVSLRIKTLKNENLYLTGELHVFKQELDKKLQQYETVESQRQALQRSQNKFEEGFEQLTAEIVNYRHKVWDLAMENRDLLGKIESLSQQLEREKEQNGRFTSRLQRLCSAICHKHDFKDEFLAMEAIETAFNQLSLDWKSLLEKESEATKKAEGLAAEKGTGPKATHTPVNVFNDVHPCSTAAWRSF